jgi:hypothetical protein
MSTNKAGYIEYKMPYALAKAYLSMRKESEKKLNLLKQIKFANSMPS